MDLDFTEEQEMLRETVRGVCERYVPIDTVRELEDDPIGFTPDFWKQMGELGLLGLTLPAQYGGAAMSSLDAAIVYEEFGRSLAPSPHFVSCVLGAGCLVAAASDEQKQTWLPQIASGDAILSPAWLEPDNGYSAVGVQMKADAEGDDYVISGVKRHVHFAASATRLVVLVRTGSGDEDVSILLVDPKADGVSIELQPTLAADTQYKVTFDKVRVASSEMVGAAGTGWATWDDVMHDGIILCAAQAVGGAERALEITVRYANEREQFDRPIGSFQSLAHYMADGATAVDGGKTLVYQAAWARANGRDVNRLAPMAKLFACDTYRDVTRMCEQVHGGYGFTIEFDIQLFFRRAKQLQLSWWDGRYLEELTAAAVLDS
jgi:alkylation response protein AidB-like acyl-CoA dehydrogenase